MKKPGRKRRGALDIPQELNKALNLHNTGNFSQAEILYKKIIRQAPTHHPSLHMLGMLYLHSGNKDKAIDLICKSVKNAPNRPDYLFNLAKAYHECENFDSAITTYKKCLKLVPDDHEALYWLGRAWHEKEELGTATDYYKQALALSPNRIDTLNSLGLVYNSQNNFDQAARCYEQALSLSPNDFVVLNNLGNIFKEQGRIDEATNSFRQAIIIRPDYIEAHNNLGNALKDQGMLVEAEASYRQALSLKPDFPEGHNNLGSVLKYQGRLDEAEASYRQALVLKHFYPEAQSNLLLCLNYKSKSSTYKYLEAARDYGQRISNNISKRFSDWNCHVKPERLRIGMVSGDFGKHPVGYFLESMLAEIDPTQIDLIAYPTRKREDDLTTRIRPYFVDWKNLAGISNEAAAHLIHKDGVHVLIDLSGHTKYSRLPVFGWKPAPVQTTWLGYFASTGVAEMDYIIADPVSVLEHQKEQFTEEVWNIPNTRFCFSPPLGSENMMPTPLPALNNGYITFGCFQNFAKINDEMLVSWGRILQTLPQARMLFLNQSLNSPALCEHFHQRLINCGINPEHVKLEKTVPRQEYFGKYAHVDIMLDTFPFTGGTTTCEALWMGVPTVTLAGDTLVSRQGASFLACVGLNDWVTLDMKDYEAKAIALSTDLEKLSLLRSRLRHRVMQSPLLDAKQFARSLETALWGMWKSFNSEQ